MSERGSAVDGDRYTVTVRPTADATGIRFVDPIERRQLTLETSTPAEPVDVEPTAMQFPVDRAVAVETGALTLDTVTTTIVRDGDGGSIAQFEHLETKTVENGPVLIELCAPIKLYLQVDGGVVVRTGIDRTEVELLEPGQVIVGGRSHHEHPSAEITVPPTPTGVMAGISTFGTALKTLTPERSFPTLRGHPPTFAIGDSVDIPSELAPPDTGVVIEIPESYESAFTVASLAYYLAATVEPGSTPTLHLGNGRSYALDAEGLETTVAQTLKQSLLLDCVVRTEGLYEIPLAERQALESATPGIDTRTVDPSAFPDIIDRLPPLRQLYHWPLAERLDAYLQLEYDDVVDVLPDWHLEAVVQPSPEYAEALPFLADRLATVRTRSPFGNREFHTETNGATNGATNGDTYRRRSEPHPQSGTPTAESQTDDHRAKSREPVTRGSVTGGSRRADRGRQTGHTTGTALTVEADSDHWRSTVAPPSKKPPVAAEKANEAQYRGPTVRSGNRDDVLSPSKAVALRTGDATTTTWIGDGFPINAAMTPIVAFENRLSREPITSDLDFVVVCNESEMGAEQRVVESVYGARSDLSFEVDIRTGLTREELAAVFEEGHDFFHYIGHVDVQGFRCADGHLDAADLDTVDLDAFFLNACHSVDQGIELIEQGAISGIVTLDSVLNRDAVEFGQTVARLLNSGFRVGAAVQVGGHTLERDHLYNVIGDPTLAVTQGDGAPSIYELEVDGDGYRLGFRSFQIARGGQGSFFRPYIEHVDTYFLNGSPLADIPLSCQQLREYLTYDTVPIIYEEQLYWSSEFADSVLDGGGEQET